MFVVRVPGPYPCNLLTMKTTQLTLPGLRQPAPRLALNFIRRYKWAFRPEYARLRPQVAVPDLTAFASASEDVLKNEQEPLRIHFERARDGLAGLNVSTVGVAGPWHEDRVQVTNPSTFTFFFLQTELFSQCEVAQSLSSVAGELALAVPDTIVGLNDFDSAKLDWARLSCRWFPGVSDI